MKKRFYKQAAVIALDGGGHGVALDGRPIRTPGGAQLSAPTLALAEAIAAEWDAQDDDIRPLTMPMMRLTATAIDKAGRERAAIVDGVAAYGGSDLLCYRAEGPDSLVARQAAAWQPLLDWAAAAHGARLAVTQGISYVAQDMAALAALRKAVEALDDYRLAAVSQLAASCGSLIIALAVEAGRVDADQATEASQLDEDWQAEQWGQDKEAADRRRNVATEIKEAVQFLGLLAG